MAKLKLFGKNVIGMDESNNGFHKEGLPIVIAGSLIRDYSRAHPCNEQFEKKRYAYSPENREKFMRRAKEFLGRNTEFCYTTISPLEEEEYGLIGRAMAMASVVGGIMERYHLRENLTIVSHRIDTGARTKFVETALSEILGSMGLKMPLGFRADEDYNRPIRKADRTAYYLAGLRYGSEQKRWPWRTKKVRFDHFRRYPDIDIPGD